jgi:uncharacterized protein
LETLITNLFIKTYMIRKLELSTVSILLFILIVNTSADGQNRSMDNNSLLWEISGNGLEKPSYLFGTIHMIPKKDYFFTEAMKNKFDSSSALVLEMKLNIPLKEQVKVAGKTFLPGNKTLQDYMSESDYQRFITFLSDSLDVNKRKIKKYVRLKPFFSSA